MSAVTSQNSTEETIPATTARRVRHTLSTAISFIRTSVDNLSGERPNRGKATELYAIGAEKLREALSQLDQVSNSKGPDAKELGYNLTVEETYTSESPLVNDWTKKFQESVQEKKIFDKFESIVVSPTITAGVIGTLWHDFSSLMPWFLCQASAMVSTNLKRHYVIQTAFEELGMRNSREIHADMFWSAAVKAGANEKTTARLNSILSTKEPLNFLRNTLLSYKNDDEILGVLLGLEIPAIENIEAVFRSLAHSPEITDYLDKDKFFHLHRQIEIEHVRLTVANFLRFCPTHEEQQRFITGFVDGLNFWKMFWDSAADACLILDREANA